MLLLVGMSSISSNCQSKQSEQIKIIKNFINDLTNQIDDEILIQKYLFLTSDSIQEVKEIVKKQIVNLRVKVKSIDKINLSYTEYADTKEANRDLILSIKEAENTFILSTKEDRFLLVLMEDYKIRSFSTMHKGGKRVFLLL
jgi:ABC-type Na+ efflux pump permease subunit